MSKNEEMYISSTSGTSSTSGLQNEKGGKTNERREEETDTDTRYEFARKFSEFSMYMSVEFISPFQILSEPCGNKLVTLIGPHSTSPGDHHVHTSVIQRHVEDQNPCAPCTPCAPCAPCALCAPCKITLGTCMVARTRRPWCQYCLSTGHVRTRLAVSTSLTPYRVGLIPSARIEGAQPANA